MSNVIDRAESLVEKVQAIERRLARLEGRELYGTTFVQAQTIDVSSATALLVEDDGVNDDVLVVDTSTPEVEINGTLGVEGFLRIVDAGELTISSGAITPTGTWHSVDTEGEVGSDDLTTINTTNCETGAILILFPANGSRTVVLKDASDNLRLSGDFAIDGWGDCITLILSSAGNWVELSRSDNN